MSGAAGRSWHGGGCHCGAVRFEVRAAREVTLTDCNCSMCSMTGFLHLIVPQADFRLLQGADRLTTYTFNTGTAKHTFCSACGVKSFYVPRSHPDGFSVNFRCLDSTDGFEVTINPFDGRDWENAKRLPPLEA